jgi:hypothetical protein
MRISKSLAELFTAFPSTFHRFFRQLFIAFSALFTRNFFGVIPSNLFAFDFLGWKETGDLLLSVYFFRPR